MPQTAAAQKSRTLRVGRGHVAAAQRFGVAATGRRLGPRQAVELCIAAVSDESLESLSDTISEIIRREVARLAVHSVSCLVGDLVELRTGDHGELIATRRDGAGSKWQWFGPGVDVGEVLKTCEFSES